MLPLLNNYRNTIKLPFLKREIELRPWLVGEEKAILMAMESKDSEHQIKSIENLIRSCIMTEDFDMDTLSVLDLEVIFIELKKMSADPVSRLFISHPTKENADVCDHKQEVEINLNDMVIQGEIKDSVQIQDNASATMRLPSLADYRSLKSESTVTKSFELLERCIVTIFIDDVAYHTEEMAPGTLTKWIENLSGPQLKKLFDYFENLPYMKYDLKYTCEKCGKEETLEIRGLESFLASPSVMSR